MSGCCEGGCEITARNARQRTTLWWVLAINAMMFFVIAAAALYADSTSLLADSLDNLGDAITYALSLYAITLGARAKAQVALFKGALILAAALAVIAQLIWKLLHPAVPVFEVMGGFSLLGLTANGICFLLLWRHRLEDINMSSVWECSRNDIASNLAVFVAAFCVWITGSGWPDLLVAAGLSLLLLRSASRVIASARRELGANG
jgi:Co/Zn/Cd efflux system component